MRAFKTRYMEFSRKPMRLPNGAMELVNIIREHDFVLIIPFLDSDTVVMIREYRPVVRKWMYQLPAGMLEKGKRPLEGAKAELEEETGYVCRDLKPLFKSYPSPGTTTKRMHCFVARNLRKTRQRLEKGEVIEVKPMKFDVALSMVRNGKIENGDTIQALLYYDKFSRRR